MTVFELLAGMLHACPVKLAGQYAGATLACARTAPLVLDNCVFRWCFVVHFQASQQRAGVPILAYLFEREWAADHVAGVADPLPGSEIPGTPCRERNIPLASGLKVYIDGYRPVPWGPQHYNHKK